MDKGGRERVLIGAFGCPAKKLGSSQPPYPWPAYLRRHRQSHELPYCTHARYLKKLTESHKLPTVLSINVAARARKADVFCGRKQLGLQCSVDEFKR